MQSKYTKFPCSCDQKISISDIPHVSLKTKLVDSIKKGLTNGEVKNKRVQSSRD